MNSRWIKILNVKLEENKRLFTIWGWEPSFQTNTYPRRIHKFNNVKFKKKDNMTKENHKLEWLWQTGKK